MSTAENLAFSIVEEGHGIHCLLWNDKEDLYRTLLILRACIDPVLLDPIYFSSEEADLITFRAIVSSRTSIDDGEETPPAIQNTIANALWLICIQQASSSHVGPWLNGWRRPLSDRPGSIVVVRNPDFDAFQRNAPDLASFIGPRVFDCSTMLSTVSKDVRSKLVTRLPEKIITVLQKLPGNLPDSNEISRWIKSL
jgi:hypothetical protein